MAVTMKDVALKAGVSKSAVSRTFTDGASVSDKTREKVERAAAEMGFHPNMLASSLTTSKTKLIGLISSNFHNPVFLEIFDLFTQTLQKKGFRPLLMNLSGEHSAEQSVKMFLQYNVDGVIIASSTLPPGFSQAFADAGVPTVNSFGRLARSPKVHTVGINNKKAGKMVADLLIDRGYQSFGFLGGPRKATSTQDRFAGFKSQILKRCGPDGLVSVSYANEYTFEAGYEAMGEVLKSKCADAYFCGDDVVSIGAISAIQSKGLKVPDDIGIIGFNDMEMAGWKNIELTTVRQPIPEIIENSVELIIDMLNNPDLVPGNRVIDCDVVERSTLRSATPSKPTA